MKTIRNLIALLLSALIFSGCAAGAATAGYALKAQSADSLSADGEQRIIDRAKREVLAEISGANTSASRCQ